MNVEVYLSAQLQISDLVLQNLHYRRFRPNSTSSKSGKLDAHIAEERVWKSIVVGAWTDLGQILQTFRGSQDPCYRNTHCRHTRIIPDPRSDPFLLSGTHA